MVRLGSTELQVQRNRAELQLHAGRIADLQASVEALKNIIFPPGVAPDVPAIPAPIKPTVES